MKGRLLDPARKHREALEKSRRQEKRTKIQTGGRLVPGSGNQWHSKGDVTTKKFLIENKRTDSMSYSLNMKTLRVGRLQAARAGKRFLMQVDFGDNPRDRYVVLPLADFEELNEC